MNYIHAVLFEKYNLLEETMFLRSENKRLKR